MNLYEAMFILRRADVRENQEKCFSVLKALVEKQGGVVRYMDIWSERAMAYEIEQERDAAYILCYIELDSESVSKLERSVLISDEILRCLILTQETEPDYESLKRVDSASADKKSEEKAPVEAAKIVSPEKAAVENKTTEEVNV